MMNVIIKKQSTREGFEREKDKLAVRLVGKREGYKLASL